MKGRKSYYFICNGIKIFVFLFIGIVLGAGIQRILVPKRYYPELYGVISRILTGYYEEEENTIQIITVGASHMLYSFSPMELYERYGVTSYNLSTPNQNLPVTYFVLKEALKTQKPEVLVFDVSALYFDFDSEVAWMYVLDQMPFSRNKIEFAYEFSQQNQSNSLIGGLCPLWRYHDRWKTIKKQDFTDFYRNKQFYCKGYYMNSMYTEATVTVEWMNGVQKELEQMNQNIWYEYLDGMKIGKTEEAVYYNASISEENLNWLLLISQLCEAENIKLLLTKVPSIYFPQLYQSAWTNNKYEEIKKLCEIYGMEYFDMLYESEMEIDWETDSSDSGKHLNMLGAEKVSEELADYLMDHYEFTSNFHSDWDQDLGLYRQAKKVALLELETDFTTYLNLLNSQLNDKIIFFASSDDMASGLGEKERETLQSLGFQTEFSYGNSFLAIIENGEVKYESSSNREISFSGKTSAFDRSYFLFSSGWYTGPQASIVINGKEYARNNRGINIVVYDEVRDIVLDSVCFDTWDKNGTAYRDNYTVSEYYLRKFENYLIEKEAR